MPRATQRAPAHRTVAVSILLVSTVVGACVGGEPPPTPPLFPQQAGQTLSGAGGHYQLEVRTSPQPPIKGNNWAEYRITDETGNGVTGLSVTVRPWMPARSRDVCAADGR